MPPEVRLKDPCVLVIDDSATSRQVIRQVLSGRGLHVIEAARGSEAHALACERQPCLAILDVVLPDCSGLELCRQWREHPDLSQMPVLLISGERASRDDRLEGLFSGAYGYLLKPFDEEELLAQCLTLYALVRSQRELRERSEALERSNQALVTFASRVAHDLKAPLRTMGVAAKVLQEQTLNEEGERWVQFTNKGVIRMRKLIDDLLTYARAPDELRGGTSRIDLAQLAKSALVDLQLPYDEAGAEVTIDELPEVSGHAAPLRQVFQNLFENALRYRSEEPLRVLVSARELADQVEICVDDNGLGVPEKEVDFIFEPLRRGRRSRGVEGTGLGLAICKSVVEGHGGAIEVRPSPSGGARFCFTLARGDAEKSPTA